MRIIDIFFPQNVKCIICGREDNRYGLCEECYNSLPFITGRTCVKCGGRVLDDQIVCDECAKYDHIFNKCYSIFDYDEVIKSKLIKFKQSGYKNIGQTLSYLVSEYLDNLDIDIDIIIPMPIHSNRLKDRGFNQSEILCERLTGRYKKLVIKDILFRILDTPHQTGLSRFNRMENLSGAFILKKPSRIKGKKILLIDDIFTTGSTFDECAKVLYKAGAKTVDCLCLPRGLVYKKEKGK